MARGGLIPFSGSFNRRIAEPLDDYRVATKADLLLASTWTAGDNGVYTFLGMFAIVYADGTNNGGYILTAADYTVSGNWLKIGASIDLSAYATKQWVSENYTVKDSGVEPGIADSIELTEIVPNYDIVDLTADNLEVTSTYAGTISKGTLTADKAVKITNLGANTITVAGTAVEAGVTCFFLYDFDTDTVSVSTVLDPSIPDYSDITVNQITTAATCIKYSAYYKIFHANFGGTTSGSLIFINNEANKTYTGVYQALEGAGSGPFKAKLICTGTKLNTVRHIGGKTYISEYDGSNLSSLTFGVLADKVNKADIIGSGATKSVNRADIATSADNAVSAGYADRAYKDHNDNIIDKEYIHVSEKGADSGIATLDSNQRLNQSVSTTKLIGVIDSSNLPAYVDDVLNVQYWQGGIPNSTHEGDLWYDPGENSMWAYDGGWLSVAILQGLIYVDITGNVSYRWSGAAMISLGNPIDFATTDDAQTGTNTTKAMSPARVLESIDYQNVHRGIFEIGNKSITTAINEKISTLTMNGESQSMDTNKNVDLTVNSIQRNLTNIDATGANAGKIVLSRNIEVYKLYNTAPTTITIDTSAMNLTKFLKFRLQINQTGYYTITFPQDWLVYGSYYPVEIGEYAYEVTRGYNGQWNVKLEYRNVESLTGTVNEDAGTVIQNKILYVDGVNGSDSNTGLSWAQAFLTVQKGIEDAIEGDSVFVKGSLTGIKYISQSGNRSTAFVLKSGVNVYGGFAGTENTIYERQMTVYQQILRLPSGNRTLNVNIPTYISELSGDIDGNTTYGTTGIGFRATNATGNSYCVVGGSVVQGTTLNGFLIRGGYNNSGSSYAAGVYSVNLRIVSCVVSDNAQAQTVNSTGGGVICSEVVECIVSNNSCSALGSVSGFGGGVYGAYVRNSIIKNNNVYGTYHVSAIPSRGGGCDNCTIEMSYIYGNSASSGTGVCTGGGIYGGGVSMSVVESNTILSTTGSRLGAGSFGSIASNCLYVGNDSGNVSSSRGGAFASGTAISCIFMFNKAYYGAVSSSFSTGTAVGHVALHNCCLMHNYAYSSGGATYQDAYSITLNACSVINNKASNSNGGTHNTVLINTVVYGNRLGSGAIDNVTNTNSSSETYSAFENETRTGTGNINLSSNNTGDINSPYFTSLSADAGIVELGYQSNPDLLIGSALINSGSDAGTTTVYDVKYRPRKVGTIDIGAYEKQ